MNPIPKYNGPIAILDLLGFSDFVNVNNIDDIQTMYARIITSSFFTAEVLKENLDFMVYSDIIAIRLVNLTEEGFENFILSLCLIIQQYFYIKITGWEKTLPIRGAVSIGEYSWYNCNITTRANLQEPIIAKNVNFIVGKPVIQAHELESMQEWIGVSMKNDTALLFKKIISYFFQ